MTSPGSTPVSEIPQRILGKLDLDEIAMALSDQTDHEHRWLIDPQIGEIAV